MTPTPAVFHEYNLVVVIKLQDDDPPIPIFAVRKFICLNLSGNGQAWGGAWNAQQTPQKSPQDCTPCNPWQFLADVEKVYPSAKLVEVEDDNGPSKEDPYHDSNFDFMVKMMQQHVKCDKTRPKVLTEGGVEV